MPIEMRVLMYSDQEIIGAMAAFYRRAGKPLTVGTVRSFQINEDDPVTIDLSVETIDGDVVDHHISDQDLIGGMVMDTIKRKIPLPAEGDKKVYVIEKYVTLVVHKRRVRAESVRPRPLIAVRD